MPQDNTTIRPIGLGNVLKILGQYRPAAPTTAPVAPPADTYVPVRGTLKNSRFAGNPGLEAIASGRAVMGPYTNAEALKTVQQALTDMAFLVPLGVSGIYGGGTVNAIKNFQHFAGLKADGSLGPKTLAALDRLAPAAGATSWDRGQDPGPVPSPDLGYGKQARVVISTSQHRAFMYDKQGNLTKIYGVRTGREQVDAEGKVGHATQAGVKVVNGKNNDPTEVSTRLWPESEGRAFGTRLIDLSDYDPATGASSKGAYSGQELHGTYQDNSIGRDFSHGCIGLRNQDIEEIFDKVRRGDLIKIED
ncbi:MAG: ErfK/YbiS/YcfS/YnhG family protein [Cyanobacteria bacterium RYN_339]|nr:ErfK/YbiS/YcfS/YnhG family protein [Cyanobacteria bacterium RYN_339]